MGEYARRIQDGQEVKIGTCETLYYLRYDQRKQVNYNFGNYKWFWRIPTPDEDGILPGDFETTPLSEGKYIPRKLSVNADPDNKIVQMFANDTGIVQAKVEELGLLVNIPCHHGLKLPENTGGVKCFWNGKRDAFYLAYLVNRENELRPCFRCAACGQMFSTNFTEATALIKSLWMKLRLLHLCTEYWYEHNSEPCNYSVEFDGMEIYNISGDWQVWENDQPIISGDWPTCRNAFIERLPAREELGTEQCPIRSEDAQEWEIKEMKRRYL